MWKWASGFWNYVKHLYGPPWAWGTGVVTTAVTIATFVTAHVLTAKQRTDYETALKLVPPVEWYWWLIGLLLAALVLALVRGYESHRTSTRFFSDRTELNSAGVRDELLTSGEVWAMWPSGNVLTGLPRDAMGRLKRLILSDPTGPQQDMETYASDYLVESVEYVRQSINENTRAALRAEVPVKWHPRRSISIVIGDPYSTTSKGWARLELLLPFVHPSSRPSVTIAQGAHPAVFSALVQMFDQHWKAAKEPNVQTSTSGGLEIRSARYGFGEDPTRWRDVTDVVRQLVVANRKLAVDVRNEFLNCVGERDPFPAQKKMLEVQYVWNGVPRPIVRVKEKSRIVLPLDTD